MTLVTSLCEILHVSEHELLTASDDMHQREIEEQSRGYLRILKGYTWITYICYLAVLIPCFIGNLVTEHRLSWFFIVVGGLAMIFPLSCAGEDQNKIAQKNASGAFMDHSFTCCVSAGSC